MIKFERVSKKFGSDVVFDELSAHIQGGSLTVLLGPSGAGKSTLLRSINGLIQVDGGEVKVNGNIVPRSKKELQSFRKQIGMIFQQFHLMDRLSVMENVLCGRLGTSSTLPTLFNKFKPSDYELASHYLQKVGLYEKRFHRARDLSGGQQQRVAIARALVQQPEIILADEPVASLDPKTSHEILTLLAQLKQEEQLTVIITLHQVEYALVYAERIIGLNRGKIVADYAKGQATKEQLYSLYHQKDEVAYETEKLAQ